MATKRRRAAKGEGELLRGQILGATSRLLAAKGSAQAVSMRDIAREVGVTPAALYLHFPDKDRLIYEVCSRAFSGLAARIEGVAAGAASSPEALKLIGRAYVEWGLDLGPYYRTLFMLVPEHGTEDEPGALAYHRTIQLIGEAQAGGEIRDDIDPQAAAFGAWATVHGLVLLLGSPDSYERFVDAPDHQAVIETTLDMLIAGLRPAR